MWADDGSIRVSTEVEGAVVEVDWTIYDGFDVSHIDRVPLPADGLPDLPSLRLADSEHPVSLAPYAYLVVDGVRTAERKLPAGAS